MAPVRELIRKLDDLNAQPEAAKYQAWSFAAVIELGDALARLSAPRLAQIIKERLLDDRFDPNTVEYVVLSELVERFAPKTFGEIHCIRCKQEMDVVYALDEKDVDKLVCGNVLCGRGVVPCTFTDDECHTHGTDCQNGPYGDSKED